jgi:hypothetical protein
MVSSLDLLGVGPHKLVAKKAGKPVNSVMLWLRIKDSFAKHPPNAGE